MLESLTPGSIGIYPVEVSNVNAEVFNRTPGNVAPIVHAVELQMPDSLIAATPGFG